MPNQKPIINTFDNAVMHIVLNTHYPSACSTYLYMSLYYKCYSTLSVMFS